jgi:hypothetical protein
MVRQTRPVCKIVSHPEYSPVETAGVLFPSREYLIVLMSNGVT